MTKGLAGYVLPNYENFIYITVNEGDMFGHVDIAIHKRALENQMKYSESSDNFQQRQQIIFKRLFTV